MTTHERMSSIVKHLIQGIKEEDEQKPQVPTDVRQIDVQQTEDQKVMRRQASE